MKNFTTKIEARNGRNYNLEIHTLYMGINKSQIFQVFIAISKKVGKKELISDTIAIRYSIATQTYKAIEKLKGTTAVLYEQIIETLNKTFGKQWGI